MIGVRSLSPDGRYALSGSPGYGRGLEAFRKASALGRLVANGGRSVSPWLYSIVITAEESLERQRTHNSHLSEARQALEAGQIGQALALLTLARAVRGFERSPESLELQARVGARCRIKSYGGGWMKRTFEGHEKHVRSVAFSPDGRVALCGDVNRSGYGTWPRANVCAPWRYMQVGTETPTWRFLPTVALPCPSATIYDVLYPAKGDLLRRCGFGTSPRGNASAPSGSVRPWHFRPMVALPCCAGMVQDPGESPFSTVWDVATGECLRTFEGHEEEVNAVAFSPDGRFALSGSNDNKLRLWDIATRECLRIFEGHTIGSHLWHFLRMVALSLSGSNDKTLRLWDVVTGMLRTFGANGFGHICGLFSRRPLRSLGEQ